MPNGQKGIILFCANEPGICVLEVILKTKLSISCVITESNRATSRLKYLAENNKIPIIIDPNLDNISIFRDIIEKKDSIILSASYPKKIPINILSIFNGMAYNLHPARLPQYRGCLPTIWPILNGDEEAEYTLHIMKEDFDKGGLIDQISVKIQKHDNGFTLYKKLLDILPKLVIRNLSSLLKGEFKYTEQNEKESRYYKNTLPNNGIINWSWDSVKIHRFIRALYHPLYPSAKAIINDYEIEFLEINTPTKTISPTKPGLLEILDNKLYISCLDAWISPKKLKINGEIISQNNYNTEIFKLLL